MAPSQPTRKLTGTRFREISPSNCPRYLTEGHMFATLAYCTLSRKTIPYNMLPESAK